MFFELKGNNFECDGTKTGSTPTPWETQIQTMVWGSETMVWSSFTFIKFKSFSLWQDRDWTSLSFWSDIWGSQGVGIDAVKLRQEYKKQCKHWKIRMIKTKSSLSSKFWSAKRGWLLSGCVFQKSHLAVFVVSVVLVVLVVSSKYWNVQHFESGWLSKLHLMVGESFWKPQPPHTRQKYEQIYGPKTVELALFCSILGCMWGRGSLAHFWMILVVSSAKS